MVNYIVSGCPRSGTSMLMEILFKAGMPIAKDDLRKPDENDVYGYFEIEGIIDKIKADPKIVFNYDNKVLKVIHFGLQFLPEGNYKVIYIERNLDEVMVSMEKMIHKEDPNREETEEVFAKLNEEVKKHIQERNDMQVLFVNHHDLLTNPGPVIDRIIEFYCIDPAKKEEMVSVIDPKQYRNRVET